MPKHGPSQRQKPNPSNGCEISLSIKRKYEGTELEITFSEEPECRTGY
jgi:hypothetical protein